MHESTQTRMIGVELWGLTSFGTGSATSGLLMVVTLYTQDFYGTDVRDAIEKL